MLILLPPSEGKSAPRRGKRLSLTELSFPELTEARGGTLTALLDLCSTPSSTGGDHTPLHDQVRIDMAAATLGLGPTQADLVHRNGRLLTSPTARADKVYSGVLYDALEPRSLTGPAKRRATRWLAITSSLFGLVRPHDAIPAYRLSGNTNLPGLGNVAGHWREVLDPVVREAAGSGLVIDLRSSTYAGFWRPQADLGPQVATVRVLHQTGKQRKVVSHFNKATKGRLVRALLEDGATPRTPADLADHLIALGCKVEVHGVKRTGTQLDVVVDEL